MSAQGACQPGRADVCHGVSAQGDVCLWAVSAEGCFCLGGVCPGGCVSEHAMEQTPPMTRMIDRCTNITLLQTSFVGNKRCALSFKVWLPGKGAAHLIHSEVFYLIWPGPVGTQFNCTMQFFQRGQKTTQRFLLKQIHLKQKWNRKNFLALNPHIRNRSK